MLPLPVNIASVVGLAGSTYVAFRLSRRGDMHVSRLWIVPAVTTWIAFSAHRPFDLSAVGMAVMALGFSLGAILGWRQARASIVSVDVPDGRLMIRSDRSAILSVIALGAVTLLLSNLFAAQMLRITNAGLMMALGSVFANRLCLFFVYLRERRRANAAAKLSGASEVSVSGGQ